MKNLLSLLFVVLGFGVLNTSGQMSVDLYYNNPTDAIGDGTVNAVVTGGLAPYQYQWSNSGTPMYSSTTDGIAEGIPFSVLVIDANGDSLAIDGSDDSFKWYRLFQLNKRENKDSVESFSYVDTTWQIETYVADTVAMTVDTIMVDTTDSRKISDGWTYIEYDTVEVADHRKLVIPNTSMSETVNKTFTPIVGAMASVLFWDPFAATGIRDPRVKVSNISLQAPMVDDGAMSNMVVGKWLVGDGTEVEHNQMIAEISSDEGISYLYAIGGGKIKLNAEVGTEVRNFTPYAEGHVLYGSFDEEDARFRINGTDTLAMAGGVDLCDIDYAEPFPMMEANGTPISQGIPIVVVWLVLGALFFTFRMKFINIRGMRHAFELVRGKYDDPHDKGEVSHFQALTTALSATVGLGNIAGVAIAVSVGGAGATFWMIIAGLLGMASKFVECTLGVKYREINENGEVSGGPMYYLSKGLAKRNMGGLGKTLAIVFAILCVGGSLGGGNMFQANQAFDQVSSAFPSLQGYGFWFGVVLALLVGIVIIGGIKSIAKVTDKIVPFMVGVYVLFALIIIFVNIGSIGDAFGAIFAGAFSPEAMKGGIIGVLIIGFQRAAFSNEAGVGSASIAHSASKTNEPVSEGIVALLEPFIDTVVVCTMTALVLIFTGFVDNPTGLGGASLTSEAFSSVFPWFKWVLMVAILLFAFSTMVSWSYYGQKAWSYMFGEKKVWGILYKVIFLAFVVVGSSVGLGAVLDFSDLMILGMAFPNILGLILMSGEVKADLKDYFARIKSGAIKKHK